MKKSILCFATALILVEVTSAQQNFPRFIPNSSFEKDIAEQPKPNTVDYYLLKGSKMQRAATTISAIGGAMLITGFLLYDHRNYNQSKLVESAFNSEFGTFLMISGSTLITISIPLFIESAHYNKKAWAMTASLNMESMHEPIQIGMSAKTFPAVGVNIHW